MPNQDPPSRKKARSRERSPGIWRRPSVRFGKRGSEAQPTEIDPRIAERARKVRDKEERKAFKRAILLLLVMTLIGVGAWLAYSPYLAMRRLVVTGVVSSSVLGQLEEIGVVEGIPMVRVDAQVLEETLRSDPWVDNVNVDKLWPHMVRVTVEERSPVAWVLTEAGWRALSRDGVALQVSPDQVLPHVTGLAEAELAMSHPSLEPALGFLQHLRSDLLPETVMEIHGEQVTATVARRVVRLGRTDDLEEKARVLEVLLDGHADPGTVINLFSPRRPAIYRGIDLDAANTSPSS